MESVNIRSMAIIVVYTVVWHLLVLKFGNVLAQKHNLPMSKQEAAEECSRIGTTLVHHKDLKAGPSAPKYTEQLENGEMAWVDGYAELSPFLEWEGCYPASDLKFEQRSKMIENSLYLCSQECLSVGNTLYVAVQGNICYCLTSDFSYGQPVHYERCNISCVDNADDSCGGDMYADVNRIGSLMTDWATNQPSKRQCVYFKANQFVFGEYTASCHAFTADGYVCNAFNRNHSELENSECNDNFTYYDIDHCLKTVYSTRQEAYEDCLNMNGSLSQSSSVIQLKVHIENKRKDAMSNNNRFWLGTYRTFRTLENISSPDTACLSVAKMNDILYLEPDDCSEKKHALCRQNPNFNKIHSPEIRSVSSKVVSFTVVNLPKNFTRFTTGIFSTQISSYTENSLSSKLSDHAKTTNYIVLTLSCICLLVTSGIMILLYRKYKWLKRITVSLRVLQRASDRPTKTDGHASDESKSSPTNRDLLNSETGRTSEGLDDQLHNTYEALF